MTATDYNEIASIFEEVTASLDKKSKVFVKALEASIKNRAEFAAKILEKGI